MFDDNLAHSGWHLVGGLDMSLPFETKEDLYMANTMRGGKKNIAQKLRCAYTGEELRAVQFKGLWYAEGNKFIPSNRIGDKATLLWLASHRAGKTMLQPPPKVEVTDAEAPHEHFVDTTEGAGNNASNAAVDEFIDRNIR